MKVIIPLAGLGTRLRPHTYSRPKPLVSVAGKPVLGHVLDKLEGLDIEEVIYIIGHLGDQIERYVSAHYRIPGRYVEQKELRGQAHALQLVKEFVDQPVLIVFVDTIFEADLSILEKTRADGVIFVKEVEDPSRFGVVTVKGRHIERLVEKPKEPVSNLAVIGVYYVKDWRALFDAIDRLIERGIQIGGEYYLADALQLMIDNGSKLAVAPVAVWEDCGTAEALLQTNRYLLARAGGGSAVRGTVENSTIVEPVHIAPSAVVTGSVIGPNVSIGEKATVRRSIIAESIVNDGARIESAVLTHSLIGANATVGEKARRLNVGDASQLVIE